MELSTTQKGAVAEQEVIAAAVRIGYVPLLPRTEGRRYDVVLDTGPRLLRVQCKWGRLRGYVISVNIRTSRHTPRGYVLTTYTSEEIDAVGVYCAGTDRVYLLPIDLVEGRGHIHLRVGPARNNQQKGLHWAEQYELGAVAQLGERHTGSVEATGSSPVSSTTHVTPLS
jgi:hypothetical protein